MRFDRLYGWFKDAGDKEVSKELLSKSRLRRDRRYLGSYFRHLPPVRVLVTDPKEQQGPAFVRYDPAKPIMAGSTRGIPKTSETVRLDCNIMTYCNPPGAWSCRPPIAFLTPARHVACQVCERSALNLWFSAQPAASDFGAPVPLWSTGGAGEARRVPEAFAGFYL